MNEQVRQHESSLVSVDVLGLRLHHDGERVQLLAHERPFEPFAGSLALPGVLLGRGERITEAAIRALLKAGLEERDVLGIGQLVTFDEPNRDPRGPTLSIAVWAGIRADAHIVETAQWVDIAAPPQLAFDHNRIVHDAQPLLARMLWDDLEFTRALTGPAFPVRAAVRITASLTGREPNRGNLNRRLAAIEGLEQLDVKSAPTHTGRPGAVWAWTD